MKNIQSLYIVLVFLMLVSCNSKNETESQEDKIEYQTYVDDYGDSQLMGQVTQELIMAEPYSDWYVDNYNSYQSDTEIISNIKEPIQGYDIEAFFGTWCEDSQRDLPVFYKILKDSGYDHKQIQLIAVGGEDQGELYKKTPNGETDGKEITNVPTFIFYKDGIEVNRIVESAVGNSIEEDVMRIVTGEIYRANYTSN